MALTKDKKHLVVDEIKELLSSSKMTVVTQYQGTSVKALQSLRQLGKENGTVLKVVKNRLVRKAIESNNDLKNVETNQLTGMLLYAFNNEDEVAPAQILAQFAKKQPTIQFVGAISAEGKFLTSEEVKALASLPSKPQLIAGVVNTLQSPTRGVIGSLSGGLHSILNSLEASAKS
jgi:large subunit ribosomal protein L10